VNHLEEQATNLEGINDEKAALIRKRINNAEEVKKMYMKLLRYLNPQGRSSLNHIMVPDDDLLPRIAQLWAEYICYGRGPPRTPDGTYTSMTLYSTRILSSAGAGWIR
jgi:hypothetical protein